MKTLHASQKLGEVIPNLAIMLKQNAGRFSANHVFAHKVGAVYRGITWQQFLHDVESIAWNLHLQGFGPGDKMVLFSPNRLEMLEMEMAVMASGGIAVPIFYNFIADTAGLLIRHSDAKYLAVAGQTQLSRISPELSLNKIVVFDDVVDERFAELLRFEDLKMGWDAQESFLNEDLDPNAICLNMYTSGTMGLPKCVQLTHRNILSQQAALKQLWNLNSQDRFLSYLPWHHSFGGIFELFSALSNGATYHLESSLGKDPASIMANWKLVRPTVFFSVPKVYQALVELTNENPEAEEAFFNSGLKFVFTAAAPLPQNISLEFEKRGIPVIEGWGLTETSPCCTLTNPALKRQEGVVGMPLPGVRIRIAEENEIQVKGPNVMVGYYKNDEANARAFTVDGWYRTGDVGTLTDAGLKLISRKDRIFKLSNGEKVIPTEMERLIQNKCPYVSFALVTGKGAPYPVALLFPNKRLLSQPDYSITPMDGCFCPRSLEELSRCLKGCLHHANCDLKQKFAKVKAAAIIDAELSIEDNTLTPSLKMAPNTVLKKFKLHLDNLYGADYPVGEEVYLIRLEDRQQEPAIAKR